MDSKDLGDKKINNEQQVNEGFSAENLAKDYNPADAKLQHETEKDQKGNETTVERARWTDEQDHESEVDITNSRGTTSEKLSEKTVKNRDFNSDTTAKRYPVDHPDNDENRGNLKLDEE